MKAVRLDFNSIVENVYKLSLSDKLELRNLLENNIAESSKYEILASYKKAKQENKNGTLKFSSDIDGLMNLL